MNLSKIFTNIVEATHSDFLRKQRSITKLFPPFYDRVKKIGEMGGLKLKKIDDSKWVFSVHSGTKSDVWYDVVIEFKNIVPLLERLVKDRRLWVTDGSRIDYNKLARRFMQVVDFRAYCSCPADLYWGKHYIRSLNKYDAKYGDPEKRPPDIRNPKQYGMTCKHLQNILKVWPWYTNTMSRFLKSNYNDDIEKFQQERKDELDKFKSAAVKLGKRKR